MSDEYKVMEYFLFAMHKNTLKVGVHVTENLINMHNLSFCKNVLKKTENKTAG